MKAGKPERGRRLAIALVGLALVAVLLAGCQAPAANPGPTISHVHGLAFEPQSRALFVATHHGLVRGTQGSSGWTWDYAGPERFDFMGFTQDRGNPGTFYASGHPDDPRAFGGTNLGLRRSTDHGASWEQRSLRGQVDFHSMTTLGAPGHLAGYWQSVLKVSTDGGLTWQDHPSGTPIYSLAASDDSLWAGTANGLRRSEDYAVWQDGSNGFFTGVVTSVAVSADGQLILVSTGDGRTGSSFRSPDGGRSWTQLDQPALRDAAAPVAFAIDPTARDRVYASTAGGWIFHSADAGITWSEVRSP